MTMTLFMALGLVIFAGIINGSFALPTKYMPKWREENIWFSFAFWGFLLIPWLSLFILNHNVLAIFAALPGKSFWQMVLGGFFFGLGQICFVFALRMLGLGLAFVINIGIGTAGSAILPLLLWHQDKLHSSYGYAVYVGIVLFLSGVILGAIAGHFRDSAVCSKSINKEYEVKACPPNRYLGVAIGILAGVGSMCQAMTYIYVNPIVSSIAIGYFNANALAAYNVAWLGIFTGAFVPYVLYFLTMNIKNHSFHKYLEPTSFKYFFYTIIMGIFFWMSIIVFSKASELLGGNLGPVIAWPMFMVFIILTSNFWGWKSKEWIGCGAKAKYAMWSSIVVLIVAVIVFAYANSLQSVEKVEQPNSMRFLIED